MDKMQEIHRLISQMSETEAYVAKNLLDNHIKHLEDDRWGMDPNKDYLFVQYIPHEGASVDMVMGAEAVSRANLLEGEYDFSIYEAKHIVSHDCNRKKTTRHDR